MAAKPAPKKPAPVKAAAAAPAPKAKKEAAPKPEKAAPAPKDEANGVTRPKSGTATGKVWDIADAISKAQKRPATRAEVMEKAVADDINEATVATQYQRWRTYNGVPKAEPKPKPVKEAKAPKAAKPAKKDAAASA